MRWLAIAVVLASVPANAEDRTVVIARELAAVHELGAAGRDTLDLALHAAARTRCHAETATPTSSCLVEAATATCGDNATCLAAADVIAANLRATNDWVDQPTRMRLLRTSTNYQVALAAELHRRFAVLAAELALAGHGDAAAIDRLCHDRDRAVHACRPGDATCVPSLPWSRCVAALVWFVGGAR